MRKAVTGGGGGIHFWPPENARTIDAGRGWINTIVNYSYKYIAISLIMARRIMRTYLMLTRARRRRVTISDSERSGGGGIHIWFCDDVCLYFIFSGTKHWSYWSIIRFVRQIFTLELSSRRYFREVIFENSK